MATEFLSLPAAPWLIEGPFLSYLVYRAVAKEITRPEVAANSIVYQDYFGSGHSRKNVLTKLGGASRCLWLIISSDRLIVTAWFPFTLFSWCYDLEHVIPLSAIADMRQGEWLGRPVVDLEYRRPNGEAASLRLQPRDRDAFVDAIERGRGAPAMD